MIVHFANALTDEAKKMEKKLKELKKDVSSMYESNIEY